MIVDLSLVPLQKKAEAGDLEAQKQIALAYACEEGAIDHNKTYLLRYSKMLAKHAPEDIEPVGYGTLLSHIGNMLLQRGEYFEAVEWYKKSKDYIMNTYRMDTAVDLVQHLKIKQSMHEAIVKNLKSQQHK